MKTEKQTTKERILSEALTLFSERGYEPVTVAEIAEAVGIKAPSLYNHYESKKAIFDAIIAEMNERFDKQTSSLNLDGSEADNDVDYFNEISDETIIEIGKDLFLHFLHDEYTSKFRKMLTIEQFSNSEIAKLYSQQYFDARISYNAKLIELLSNTGRLKKMNPTIAALHYFSPIYHLIVMCDCRPEREEEALKLVEEHIRQFMQLYGNETK